MNAHKMITTAALLAAAVTMAGAPAADARPIGKSSYSPTGAHVVWKPRTTPRGYSLGRHATWKPRTTPAPRQLPTDHTAGWVKAW